MYRSPATQGGGEMENDKEQEMKYWKTMMRKKLQHTAGN